MKKESILTPGFGHEPMEGCSCYLLRQGRPQQENFGSRGDQEVGFGHVRFEMIIQHASGAMRQAFGCRGTISVRSRGLCGLFQVQEHM